MAFSALLLPLLALIAVGGPAELFASLADGGDSGLRRWTDQASLPAAVGFVLGLFGIGPVTPGSHTWSIASWRSGTMPRS